MESTDNTEPLSPEHFQVIQDAQKEIADKKRALAKELVGMLTNKRELSIRARGEANKRMVDDQRQWDGETRLMNTKEFPSQNADDHARPPRPHLTRSRCDLWESRMIDLLAPTNDPTWDLRPLTMMWASPPPGTDPQAWTQNKDQLLADARDRAANMKRVIQDQMAACNATEAIRTMCQHACRLGIGLLMGPKNGTQTLHIFDRNDQENPVKVKAYETVVPTVEAGDPWCFYPDMVKDMNKAQYAFYVHWMSQTELYEFARFPGVNMDEIEELLDEKPIYGQIETVVKERNQRSGLVENIADRYPVWHYTGIIDKKYLDALDIDKESVKGKLVSADIWFSNDHILKSKITTLAVVEDYRIPYYVFTPFPIDETPFGASIAYLCRDSDRAAASAWIIMLQNSSLSAGPQCIYRPGKIRPLDGKYGLRGPKMWQALDDSISLQDTMTFVDVPNNAANAMQVYEAAKQLLDEELNTQQWASPDTAEEMDAASGLAMIMNARTILQRRVCAAADDQVFRPLIQRFVLWNLLFNKRDDIKDNYEVLPLCQSVRLVKDIQLQQKLFVITQLSQNPTYQAMFSPYEMIKDLLRDLDVQIDNWMVSKDDWMKAQQAAQQSPEAQAALANVQLLQQKAQTEAAKQHKMFNDAQTNAAQVAADGQGMPGSVGPSPDALLKHSEFLLEKQMQVHQTNAQIAQAQADNETKRFVALTKAQSDNQNTHSAFLQAIHANRTKLIQTASQNNVKLHELSVKTPTGKAPAKPAAGKFAAPKIPRYGGGKRPGY